MYTVLVLFAHISNPIGYVLAQTATCKLKSTLANPYTSNASHTRSPAAFDFNHLISSSVLSDVLCNAPITLHSHRPRRV
jgi:hypothetical protein